MELVNIGFGNLIAAGRLIAVVSPDSAPIKRLIQETRDGGMLIDAPMAEKRRRYSLWTVTMWCCRHCRRRSWRPVWASGWRI